MDFHSSTSYFFEKYIFIIVLVNQVHSNDKNKLNLKDFK